MLIWARTFLLVSLLSASCGFTQGVLDAWPRQVDYPYDGVSLGNGWDTSRATKTPGNCIEYTAREDEAQEVGLTFSRAIDKDSLMKQLRVSAEFQAKALLGARSSAKATFANSREVSNERLNLTAYAIVEQGATFTDVPATGDAIRLKSRVRALAQQDLAAFLKACGDSYVSSIHSGAELTAFLSLQTSSVTEQQETSTAVTGSFAGFTVGIEVQEKLREYAESNRLKIEYRVSGGTSNPLPLTLESLLTTIENLPIAAAEAPQNWFITLRRYDQLPNWPREDIDIKLKRLEEIAEQYSRIDTLYDDLTTILQNPNDYVMRDPAPNRSTLADLQDELGNLRSRLRTTLDTCLKSVVLGNCKLDKQDAIPDYEYRYRMTVPVGSVTYTDLTTISQELERLQAVLEKTPPTIPETVVIGDAPPIPPKERPNPNVAWLINEIVRLEREFAALNASNRDGLRNAIHVQWISTPSVYRCAMDDSTRGCLSNSEKDEYLNRITAYLAD